MNEELVRVIRERKLLLDRDVYELLSAIPDISLAKTLLDLLERLSGQKILTKTIAAQNFVQVHKLLGDSSGAQALSEQVSVKLGINLEITRAQTSAPLAPVPRPAAPETNIKYQVFYADTKAEKKLEVSDFTGHFRSRYAQLQRILMQRSDLQHLVSINKISGDRQQIHIIAYVTEKRTTKNKNMIINFEDPTGTINGLVKVDKPELFRTANELLLDDVVAIKATGSRDMLFIQEIIYPDSVLPTKTRFEEEACIAFISDMHCGSDRHLKQSLQRFIDWLKSDDETARKIKFMFLTGDTIDGVGIFPGQENFLELKSMKEQYALLASYLKQVPKRITMFHCCGQHDAARVAEPQPIVDRKYAEALYAIDNLVLVTNPTLVKFIEGDKEFKVLMYHGASIHDLINEIQELREIKAHKSPAKAVKHMLKRRHLSPTHGNGVYIPNMEKDPLVITEVPDVLCTGEVHRLDIETYNGTLIITGSCWQAQTAFEEKIGNVPDPAKVPVLNMKTRELKIYDFGVEEEINRAR